MKKNVSWNFYLSWYWVILTKSFLSFSVAYEEALNFFRIKFRPLVCWDVGISDATKYSERRNVRLRPYHPKYGVDSVIAVVRTQFNKYGDECSILLADSRMVRFVRSDTPFYLGVLATLVSWRIPFSFSQTSSSLLVYPPPLSPRRVMMRRFLRCSNTSDFCFMKLTTR